MTKQILLSVFALLVVLVTISSAVERKDGPLLTNDLIAREARAAEPGDERKRKTINKKRKNKMKRNKSKKNKKKNKRRNNKMKMNKIKKNKKGNARKVRKNNSQGKKKIKNHNKKRRNQKKVEKEPKSGKNKNNTKQKTVKKESKLVKNKKKSEKSQKKGDGNTIVCPECPKSSNSVCKPKSGRKLSKKEKRLVKKMKKVDQKIEQINQRIRKSRNDGENDDDKFCKPCCPPPHPPPPPPPHPTPAPPPHPSPAPPAHPPTHTTTSPCDECLKESVTGMEVWRVQVTNFQKQCKRVQRQSDIAANKANKTGAFELLATHLEQFDSPQECPSNSAQIISLKSILTSCSTDVPAACKLTMVDQTFKDKCTKKTDDYVVRNDSSRLT